MDMGPRGRVFLLIAIMAFLCLLVESLAIGTLYRAALAEERLRLQEAARSQARLIEAIARFSAKHHPEDSSEATLSQIVDAHEHYEGFGETGEFTLSKREGDQIVFLLSHRHFDLQNPKPVPFEGDLAEPMQKALSGKSGTIIGRDYRGVMVLAAHEPVRELDLGIVAKIDLAEVRAPFVEAALASGFIGILGVSVGVIAFIRVTNPLIRHLTDTVKHLEDALRNVRVLRGLLPICASCKKVRDDRGYWNQIEAYVTDHSEAQFSHGICPECAEKLYGEDARDL